MKQIYTTTLRLNLADEDDRRAYEHLQRMDKKLYRSYSKTVVAAVNDYFERQERLTADPLNRACGLHTPVCSLLCRQPPQKHRPLRMTRIFRRLWTLRTASDTAIAFVWYDCDTERRHFCYYKYFQKKRDTKREDVWYYIEIN